MSTYTARKVRKRTRGIMARMLLTFGSSSAGKDPQKQVHSFRVLGEVIALIENIDFA
jgi:hypothetical protein